MPQHARKDPLDYLEHDPQFPEHEKWEHSAHYEHEEKLLVLRNICVAVAALLFLGSLLPSSLIGHAGYPMRGVAYFFGAGAYVSELLVLTNGFSRKEPLKELFMPYVFGVLYIILGINYLLH